MMLFAICFLIVSSILFTIFYPNVALAKIFQNEFYCAFILTALPQLLCQAVLSNRVWGRYYFDTFIDKAKKGEIFKGNKILNKNSGKIGFDTFRLKLVESNLTLIPFLHDFDKVLG